MLGLIHADASPARELEVHKGPPTRLCLGFKWNLVRAQRSKDGLKVGAHEVQRGRRLLLCGVHRKFGRWQSKDQPTAAGVDSWEVKDVAEEHTISVSVPAVDDEVS